MGCSATSSPQPSLDMDSEQARNHVSLTVGSHQERGYLPLQHNHPTLTDRTAEGQTSVSQLHPDKEEDNLQVLSLL